MEAYDVSQFQPIFADVEMKQGNGLPLIPPYPLTGQLKARYLQGGQLALVKFDYNLANDDPLQITPVTGSELYIYFQNDEEMTSLQINIKGSYLCSSLPFY